MYRTGNAGSFILLIGNILKLYSDGFRFVREYDLGKDCTALSATRDMPSDRLICFIAS